MQASNFPSLALLQQVISPRIDRFTCTLLKTNANLTHVSRLALHYHRSQSGPRTVILKQVQPVWTGDPDGPDREGRFYTDLLPRLAITQAEAFFIGLDPLTQQRLVVLEDIGSTHRFPPPAYVWTREELEKLLRAYARFHVAAECELPPENERSWLVTYHRPLADTQVLAAMAGELAAVGIWPALPHLERLAAETQAARLAYETAPFTLLHHDVYPPNLALPRDGQGEAIILDWEMAGWGLCNFDLAYLFAQPFRSAQALSQEAAFDLYWQERQALQGRIPCREERWRLQRYADALLTLHLVPVAYQAVKKPYPPGSPAATYWEAMRVVLLGRIQDLCLELAL